MLESSSNTHMSSPCLIDSRAFWNLPTQLASVKVGSRQQLQRHLVQRYQAINWGSASSSPMLIHYCIPCLCAYQNPGSCCNLPPVCFLLAHTSLVSTRNLFQELAGNNIRLNLLLFLCATTICYSLSDSMSRDVMGQADRRSAPSFSVSSFWSHLKQRGLHQFHPHLFLYNQTLYLGAAPFRFRSWH